MRRIILSTFIIFIVVSIQSTVFAISIPSDTVINSFYIEEIGSVIVDPQLMENIGLTYRQNWTTGNSIIQQLVYGEFNDFHYLSPTELMTAYALNIFEGIDFNSPFSSLWSSDLYSPASPPYPSLIKTLNINTGSIENAWNTAGLAHVIAVEGFLPNAVKINTSAVPIPEPAGLLLFGLGLLWIARIGRRTA